MQIGKHFTLEELTHSQTAVRLGIPNLPGPSEIANLRCLSAHILDPLRRHIGPVVISSGYRGPKLNAAVRGSRSSQHVQGLAADITVPGHSIAFVVSTIRKLNLPFDQLIDEFGSWVHVSWSPRHRREVLVARKGENNVTTYSRTG